MDFKEKLYAIREVSEITGVKPVTLRAWQRRYHLLEPKRTEKGHRLYDDQDIYQIQQIQQWLAKGISIGKVSQLLAGRVSGEFPPDIPLDNPSLDECDVLLAALFQLNRGKAEAVIAAVFKEYPLLIVEQRFVTPIMGIIGRMKGSQKSLQKGLLQSVMLTQLTWMITAENRASHQGKCLCVSFDPAGGLWAWIQALKQAEQGYYTVLLDGVEDVSGLVGHEHQDTFQKVDFFANRSLTGKQQQGLHQFREAFTGEVSYSGM